MELEAKNIKFCYSCSTDFPWEGGPNPYCGHCGAEQPIGYELTVLVKPLTARFAEVGVDIV